MSKDVIVTISISAQTAADVQMVLDHFRTIPGYATDNANVAESRRGGYEVRYAPVVLHK